MDDKLIFNTKSPIMINKIKHVDQIFGWNVTILLVWNLFIVPIKKMTNDRPIQKLNFLWQVSIHFNWPMEGQYDVIFLQALWKASYLFLCNLNFIFLIAKLFYN